MAQMICPFARRDKDGSLRLQVRALGDAARGRLEGSSAQIFLRRPGALAFAGSIRLSGAALLIWVFPFVILLSSLANHQIDTDLSWHAALNRQGAVIVSQLSGPPLPLGRRDRDRVDSGRRRHHSRGPFPSVTCERVVGQQRLGWKDVLRFAAWAGVLFGFLVISDSRLCGTIGVVSRMVWFIAVGAVILLCAVADATWNQRTGRSSGAKA